MDEAKIILSKKETEGLYDLDPINIYINEIKYSLNIKTKEDNITFSINDKEQFPSVNYIRTMKFKEIKDLNKVFSLLNSFNDFYDFLKSLSETKKINMKKSNDKISLIFFVEVLLKQSEIQIDLFPEKKDLELNIKEIYQELINMKSEINFLKKENQKLNNDIDLLKKENKELRNKINEQNKEILDLNEDIYYTNMTDLIKKDERYMIFTEIENKMNKKIQKLKKLYQATVDGGDPATFHSKCDNIPNTLIIIKSQDNKRFGGFTPIPWKSSKDGFYTKDEEKKTFIFTLDYKKISNLNNTNNVTYNKSDCGPCFGDGWDISIEGNPIKENKLWVFRSGSFDYKGIDTPLSECSYNNKGKASEYEVFQVIFSNE